MRTQCQFGKCIVLFRKENEQINSRIQLDKWKMLECCNLHKIGYSNGKWRQIKKTDVLFFFFCALSCIYGTMGAVYISEYVQHRTMHANRSIYQGNINNFMISPSAYLSKVFSRLTCKASTRTLQFFMDLLIWFDRCRSCTITRIRSMLSSEHKFWLVTEPKMIRLYIMVKKYC